MNSPLSCRSQQEFWKGNLASTEPHPSASAGRMCPAFHWDWKHLLSQANRASENPKSHFSCLFLSVRQWNFSHLEFCKKCLQCGEFLAQCSAVSMQSCSSGVSPCLSLILWSLVLDSAPPGYKNIRLSLCLVTHFCSWTELFWCQAGNWWPCREIFSKTFR